MPWGCVLYAAPPRGSVPVSGHADHAVTFPKRVVTISPHGYCSDNKNTQSRNQRNKNGHHEFCVSILQVCVRKTVLQWGQVTSMYLPARTRSRPPQLGQVITVFRCGAVSFTSVNSVASFSASLRRGVAVAPGVGIPDSVFLNPLNTQTIAAITTHVPRAPSGPIPATIALTTTSASAIPLTSLNRRAPSDRERMSFQI